MNDVMAISLQTMQNDAARLDRVSANLANATTPGYKREVLVQRAGAAMAGATFAGLVEAQALASSQRPQGTSLAGAELLRDMHVGTLKNTGQPYDFALAGSGFFEVSTPSGPAYTRHGQFQVDSRGRLVTQQGYAVMGSGGEIVVTGTPSVDSAGNVTENGRTVAKLRVVDFGQSERLERLAGGLYAAGKSVVDVDDKDVQVRQGYLENTNVDPMREMVDMIGTMRHFESMQRVTQSYDDMVGTAIRRLGDI